jgi:chaperonin GroEL
MFLCPLSLSRKAMLEDIAVLTKGELISEELGVKLESVTLDMLVTCKKVRIDKENTTITDGAGKKKDIQGRIGRTKSSAAPGSRTNVRA